MKKYLAYLTLSVFGLSAAGTLVLFYIEWPEVVHLFIGVVVSIFVIVLYEWAVQELKK